MISTQRIILLVASICFLALVVRLIRRKHLSFNHSLLWILLAFAGMAAALVPTWVYALATLLGFELPANFTFFVCIFFLIVAMLMNSMALTSQADTIRGLTQEISLLNQRVEAMERANQKNCSNEATLEAELSGTAAPKTASIEKS